MDGNSLAVRGEQAIVQLLLDSGEFAETTAAADRIPVVAKYMPDAPTNIVAVTGYNESVNPDPGPVPRSALVQIRVRADSVARLNRADQTISRLLDVTGARLSDGVRIQRAYRISYGFLGRNEGGLFESTANYRIY